MLRLVALLLLVGPFVGVFSLFAGHLTEDTLGPPLVIGAILTTAVWVVGYYLFLDRVRPRDDISHLKAQLEANGARVLSTLPAGVKLGGRSGPDFRVYRCRVRQADGTEALHTVEVEATLFGGGLVQDRSEPPRHTPLNLS